MIYSSNEKVIYINIGNTPIMTVMRGTERIFPDVEPVVESFSCFARGHWVDDYPWTDDLPWKD